MFEFLWFVVPILLLPAVYSSYRLVKDASARFGKADAEKMTRSPLIRWLWKRFGYPQTAVISWVLLTFLLSGLILGIAKIGAFLLVLDAGSAAAADERYAFFLGVGLTGGMVCLMAMRNRESLSLMRNGDLWIKNGAVCRRLDPRAKSE